jgi:hypothetical protein
MNSQELEEIFTNFDTSKLTFSLVNNVAAYFASLSKIPRNMRTDYLSLADYKVKLLSNITKFEHFNEHVIVLLTQYLEEFSLVKLISNDNAFDYVNEPVLEPDFINDVLSPLLFDPFFGNDYFKELETFDQLLICSEILELEIKKMTAEIIEITNKNIQEFEKESNKKLTKHQKKNSKKQKK